MNKNIVTHVGSCHCKEVQFEAIGEENIEIIICSCSICSINNYKHYNISSICIFKNDKEIISRTTKWNAVTVLEKTNEEREKEQEKSTLRFYAEYQIISDEEESWLGVYCL